MDLLIWAHHGVKPTEDIGFSVFGSTVRYLFAKICDMLSTYQTKPQFFLYNPDLRLKMHVQFGSLRHPQRTGI